MYSRNVAVSKLLPLMRILSSTINRSQLLLYYWLHIRFGEHLRIETHYCALKMECNDQSYRRLHTFFYDAYSTPLPSFLSVVDHFEGLKVNSESHILHAALVSVPGPQFRKQLKSGIDSDHLAVFSIQNKHISIASTEKLTRFIFSSASRLPYTS